MIKKVAVTGASGHIGNCLVRTLLSQGVKVKILIHKFQNGLNNLDVEIVKGGIDDTDALKQLCEDIDIVYHLAARIAIDKKDKGLVYKTNVDGTQNLIDICLQNKIKRFIHFSSIHALEVDPMDRVLDESRPLISRPGMIYEQSKAHGEKLVYEAIKSGLDAVILNPTAVIGPFDFKPSYLGQALIKIYKNKLPMLVPGGYDWVDVRDVVQATIRASLNGRSGERYLLSGHWHSLKELARIIGSINGNNVPKIMAPMFIARLGIPFIRLFSKIKNEHPLYTNDSLNVLMNSHKNISNKKARKELDFNPRPINETLNDTFEWYIQNGLI